MAGVIVNLVSRDLGSEVWGLGSGFTGTTKAPLWSMDEVLDEVVGVWQRQRRY